MSSRFEFELSLGSVFRFYFCMGISVGWLALCRKIIGLNGFHLMLLYWAFRRRLHCSILFVSSKEGTTLF